MKPLTWKVFIALLPVLAVSAAWIAWDLKFVLLLDTYKGQGSVLEKQFDRLDRKVTSGEITRRDAIKKLKTTLVTIQEADEKFMMSIKTGMIFLWRSSSTSSCVAADSRICAAPASDMIRAARFNTGPK